MQPRANRLDSIDPSESMISNVLQAVGSHSLLLAASGAAICLALAKTS
jgi:hypothetical protein